MHLEDVSLNIQLAFLINKPYLLYCVNFDLIQILINPIKGIGRQIDLLKKQMWAAVTG